MKNLLLCSLFLLLGYHTQAQCTAGTLSGADTVCVGSLTAFTSTVSGGTWSISSSSVATISGSGSLVGVATGSAVLTYTASVACGVGISTKSIYIRSTIIPAITLPPAILVGDTITARATPPGGTWVSYTPSLATVSSTGILYATADGLGILSYTDATCGNVATDSIHILSGRGSGRSDSMYASIASSCLGSFFTLGLMYPSGSAYYVRTFYGDGTSDSAAVRLTGYAYHRYLHTATYTVKHQLIFGGRVVDSLIYNYDYTACNTVSISFYNDTNGNCVQDTHELLSIAPIVVYVDSNGSRVDTVAATGSFTYIENGATGTIYQYTLAAGLIASSCLSGGVLRDTLQYSYAYPLSRYNVGVQCAGSGSNDVSVKVNGASYTNRATGVISVFRNACTADTALVTLTFSSRYAYSYASPAPASVTSTTATWRVRDLAASTPQQIVYVLLPSGSALSYGDTVTTRCFAGPLTGDPDTTNNVAIRRDTIRGPFDPNHITVQPERYILNGTHLSYLLQFENIGNDTAHNVHIEDTLFAGVQVASLRLTGASAPVTVNYIPYGSRTIIVFDFPGINLADSSHHNANKGFVSFTIDAARGLADGTIIPARAGIYFDYNSVIMTNTDSNVIVVPAVSIAASDTVICAGDSVTFRANFRSAGVTSVRWYINSRPMAATGSVFTTDSLSGGDTIKCRMISTMDESITTWSGNIIIHTDTTPVSGSITARPGLCAGDTVSLWASRPGGTWSLAGGSTYASLSGTILTARVAGTDTVLYTVTNHCGSARAVYPIHIDSVVTPSVSASASVTGAICEGTPVTFNAHPVNGGSAPAFIWWVSGRATATGPTYTFAPMTGDVVDVLMASSAVCVTVDSVRSASIALTINPVDTPDITISSTVDSTTSVGQLVTFTAYTSMAGSSTRLQWYVNGNAIPGATNIIFSYHPVRTDTVYCVLTTSLPCTANNTDTSNASIFTPLAALLHDIAGPQNILLWPNPSSGNINLLVPYSAAINGQVTIEVYSATGELVQRRKVDAGLANAAFSLQLDDVAPGSYMARIITDGQTSVVPFTIVR